MIPQLAEAIGGKMKRFCLPEKQNKTKRKGKKKKKKKNLKGLVPHCPLGRLVLKGQMNM